MTRLTINACDRAVPSGVRVVSGSNRRPRSAATARRIQLGPLGSLADAPFTLRTLRKAGIVRAIGPRKLAAVARELRRWGTSPAGGIAAAAAGEPDRVALLDEVGSLSAGELHGRSNSLARALRERGVRSGDGVAVMCRNHRGFVDATLAASKVGATVLYLNTAFAAPQLAGVLEREGPAALVYDQEFAELFPDGEELRLAAATSAAAEDQSLEDVIAATSDAELAPPDAEGGFVVLTSGTTGTPRGARRTSPGSIAPMAALLDRIPLRAREPTHIAAPMFHSWGLAHFVLGLALNSTYVLRRTFDPEDTLRAVAEARATGLALVPVMMQRILALPLEVRRRYDLSALRVVAVSGSALPGRLATEWMDAFGDTLYNLYGSTEVAWATIATPDDLRSAPGTAGRPPRHTRLRIVDEDGADVPAGEIGRIFVGNEMAFEGYTGGGGKSELDRLLSSGDVGHLDEAGRLFVDGRDDEMIVSGGENVFPKEVEDVLIEHAAVGDAAAVGVPDEEFGQRLVAFVVPGPDASVTDQELRDYVKGHLARYKVPREVRFLDELPRNPSGKILKRVLREMV